MQFPGQILVILFHGNQIWHASIYLQMMETYRQIFPLLTCLAIPSLPTFFYLIIISRTGLMVHISPAALQQGKLDLLSGLKQFLHYDTTFDQYQVGACIICGELLAWRDVNFIPRNSSLCFEQFFYLHQYYQKCSNKIIFTMALVLMQH